MDFWSACWSAAAGLISACGENPLRFCPDEPRTRAVAAQMLFQAKDFS
ncbi:MAG: hypothetical protein IIC78_00560 [Chloroflexi bacterium]|nr:hypothetical protein [Chloroflexota bacterium]